MPDAPPLDHLNGLEALLPELHAAAAQEILPRFRHPMEVEDKTPDAGFDPVTIADRDAEAAIRALIARRFPEHGVLGEEHGADRADAEWVWVLDPVDGTRAFIAGLPLWTTLIGLRFQGRPVLGSIGQPYIGELFVGRTAAAGGGATLIAHGSNRPLRVRPCPGLAEATIATTDPQAHMSAPERAAWDRIRASARLTRLGGDGYLFAMIAAGGVDLVVESGLKPWDVEPCLPVVEGAGGVVANWRGAALDGGGQVAACGDRRCLDEALASLEPAAA